MAKTIQLSNERYNRLVGEARERGFHVKAGPGSQLGDFIEWLIDNAPPRIAGNDAPEVGVKAEFSNGGAPFEQYDL